MLTKHELLNILFMLWILQIIICCVLDIMSILNLIVLHSSLLSLSFYQGVTVRASFLPCCGLALVHFNWKQMMLLMEWIMQIIIFCNTCSVLDIMSIVILLLTSFYFLIVFLLVHNSEIFLFSMLLFLLYQTVVLQ